MNFSAELGKNPIFKTVQEVSEQLGYQTFVVGGFVRDLIMKRPSKDIDFVCVGSGIQLAEAVARKLGTSVSRSSGTLAQP